MRYMRCRCGELTCWTSMGSPECVGCEKCGTTLAESPSGHSTPIAHDPVVERKEVTTTEGTTVKERRYCRRCMQALEVPDAGEELLKKLKEPMDGFCRCEKPSVKCDMRGSHCTICGLPC